jgi:hypothetical protein
VTSDWEEDQQVAVLAPVMLADRERERERERSTAAGERERESGKLIH